MMTEHVPPNDKTRKKINDIKDAHYILKQLNQNHPRLSVWEAWSDQAFDNQDWLPYLTDLMHMAYARMCHRNGSLSNHPRSYHNEFHCNDLCDHLIECHTQFDDYFSPSYWALLSYFCVCHDLQQGLPTKQDDRFVGTNEAASFAESQELLDLVESKVSPNPFTHPKHLLLFKTMIEGSTFGRHADNKRYFFQGNIANHLLESMNLNDEKDIQLIYLACDIDTANVSLAFNEYARSAIRVYDELKAHQLIKVRPRIFFSDEQVNYFFNQQKFYSEPAIELYEPRKQRNAPLLKETAAAVKSLPKNADVDTIKHCFISTAEKLMKSP